MTLRRTPNRHGEYDNFGFHTDPDNVIFLLDKNSVALTSEKFRIGDVIHSINKKVVSSKEELSSAFKKTGQCVELGLKRIRYEKGKKIIEATFDLIRSLMLNYL